VRLFLDTSVLLAAAGSTGGASRFVITEAEVQEWALVSADYCVDEVRRNLPKLVSSAPSAWRQMIFPALEITEVRLTLDRPLVFPKAKDRPVVISALAARCEWLLTLDEGDFHGNLGREIYGMRIATPGEFLMEQRQDGLL
jgi:predicted nucleic acid-binding protein